MTLPALQEPLFGPAAYLDWETEQIEKHEYLNGEVFAMAGASEAHVTIALNVAMALRTHLRGGPCSVFISDMKLRVEQANAFFYPDVLVTCAEADRAHTQYKTAPSLIVEVLSPSTSAYDRGDKFAAYRSLPSVREYLLIDAEHRRAELFRRDTSDPAESGAGRWLLYPLEGEQVIDLASVGLQLPLAAVYEDVRWDPDKAAPVRAPDTPTPAP